eukprot:CCRYP_004860-RB/>CCRYP_004860-RB protein AED:0.32 eAED:0.32 QI:548/1/1/1/0/0/2/416/90
MDCGRRWHVTQPSNVPSTKEHNLEPSNTSNSGNSFTLVSLVDEKVLTPKSAMSLIPCRTIAGSITLDAHTLFGQVEIFNARRKFYGGQVT